MSSKIRVKNEPMYKSQIEEVWQKRKRKKGVTLTTAMCQTKVQAIVEKYPYNLESVVFWNLYGHPDFRVPQIES